jgi:glycosyltransferase involved in cell wall biosynthesis
MNQMTEFSIAIPAHDRGENGPKWMAELLDTLEQQTFQDFEVVVSDQSKNDKLMNVCQEYDFDFTYIKYEGSVPCENINTAVDNCEGRIIKMMFSDDIFMRKDALERIKYEYDTCLCKWAFSGFANWDGDQYFDEKLPEWREKTLEGNNHLSSPTVVSFLNECKMEFDLNLKLLLDVDFYHRMRWKYGLPNIIPEVLVANRDHDDRISSDATSQYDCVVEHPDGNWMMNSKELRYVTAKYPEFMISSKYPDEN